jgi:hypothetical protein
LIVIPLLGLAVLSSVGVEYCLAGLPGILNRYGKISPSNARRFAIVLFVLLALVQFHSQKTLFNRFNAVVPSSWFFPLTPSIRYVKANLESLQSVIADSSFNRSGTLGAYGIPQWYAHTFRTENEKKVLGRLIYNPFPTLTSAFIDGRGILLDSSLMEKLAVKFLLVHKDTVEDITVLEPPALSHVPAPPLPGNSWKQHLHVPEDLRIGYIAFLFSTHPEERAPANVRLVLSRDADGSVVATSELDRDETADNQYGYFRFPQGIVLKKGDYSLALSLADPAGPGKLTVWTTKVQDVPRNSLEINGIKTDSSMIMRILQFQKKDLGVHAKRWTPIDLEQDILILENKLVTNSAYFVKNLDAENSQVDFSGLAVTQPSSGAIEVDYSGGDEGWIVLPMHLHPGWKAYVQDRQVRYDTYLDILPAIPVRGASRILFRYEPASFKIGALLSAAGVLLFALFCVRMKKYGTSTKPV